MELDDALPCRHRFSRAAVDRTKDALVNLPLLAPEVLAAAGIDVRSWPAYLRAAVESLRGSWAATTTEKYRFVAEVLEYGVREGAFSSWSAVGTEGRNDFRVQLPSGRRVCLEAKG